VGNELIDIRELQGDTEAYRDELFKRWTGLLSYRYIGRTSSSMNLGEVDDTVTVRHDMRNAAGGIMAAPLAIAAPQGCQTDLVAVPNPVIASVQVLDPARDVEVLEVVPSEFLHQGRMMGYSRTLLVDAANRARVVAISEGQGAVIGTPPEGLERMDVEGTEIVIEDSPDLPPLWQVFGASRRDDGRWVLPELSLELASPDAALHIGPQHVVLETAAVDAASELMGTDRLQVSSWHVMFLARGKVGPFRVESDVQRGTAGRVGTRMVIHDEGNGDRAVTSASGVFEVVD
jgi:hypothetical protein